ncbi:MAG: tRNA (adenosine(37)-N6)-threonylcarbamoyltransferase complex ATPase subunit type 1 TsaE [bacterium]|nr:tRNA (adenosine(37)-N6)-threonylcarbamoyltransferase complex ATPase subunit type 1 TsaE [bacterium]
MKTFYTKNAEETQELAARLVKTWKGGDVVGLVGDLGAGKTTFVQGVAKALGIKRAVKSPTFLRMQVYELTTYNLQLTTFIHIDAYRIKKPEQLLELGLEDYLGRKDTLIVIEWAEKIKRILPKRMRWIRFDYGNREGERKFSTL